MSVAIGLRLILFVALELSSARDVHGGRPILEVCGFYVVTGTDWL